MTTSDVFESPALLLLLALEERGCRLDVVAGRLIVEPASQLAAQEQEAVRQHRRELVALVRCCDEGLWARREVFARQLELARPGTCPRLAYRSGVSYEAGRCHSCGDRLEQARFGRCWRCALAWRLACGLPISIDTARTWDEARVA